MCFCSWSTQFRRFEKCLMWNSERKANKIIHCECDDKANVNGMGSPAKGRRGKMKKILRHGWNTQLFICSDCDLNNKDWFFLSSSSSRLFTHVKCFSKLAKRYCVVPGLLTQKSMSEQIKGTEWKLLVKPLKPLKWLKLFVWKPFFHFHSLFRSHCYGFGGIALLVLLRESHPRGRKFSYREKKV